MKLKLSLFLVPAIFMIFSEDCFSQKTRIKETTVDSILDSLANKGLIFHSTHDKQKILFSNDQALKYLQSIYKNDNWKNNSDPLKNAIGQLIWFASNNPFDTTRIYLERYPFDSINVPWKDFYNWDTIKIKIPVVQHPQLITKEDSLTAAEWL